jgi:murein DD-endopeptidase MepM/ murein hydrolase activator NlpD
MNDLNEYRPIYPGQVLRVPSPPHDEAAETPRPMPRPHYATEVRYEPPHPTPRPRTRHSDDPPPPPPAGQDTADTHSDQQSWWSWFSKPGEDTAADPGTGKFIWPVQGRIILGFGRGNHGERNDGINIAAADGTPIRAAASGTVTYAGNELKGYGNLVLIRHGGGYVTAYAHAGTIKVSRGDVVQKGQIIGTTGATGDVDRPQLHFEIRRGVQAVDPEHYLVSERAS